MPCDLKLQITNYNVEKNKKETLLTSIGTIEQDQPIDIAQVARIIANLDKDARSALAAQLRAARVQHINNETVKQHQLVSNISLEDLQAKYPQLSKYEIPKDLQHSFTLIQCYRAEFNGATYKGRTVDAAGNEIFIINNVYDAEKLFKHLTVRRNLTKFIQGNTLDDSLKKFEESLSLIAKHHGVSIQKLIEDFLVNKNAYRTFRQGSKVYSPKRIINEVLTIITGELYNSGDKSDLQLELESIKEDKSTNNEWIFDKKNLYLTLTTFFEDFSKQYSYEQFKELDTEALNTLLKGLFANDVKLLKATVKSEVRGKKVVKDNSDKKTIRRVPKPWIQKMYKESFLPKNPDLAKKYPKFEDAAKLMGYEFKKIAEEAFPKYTDDSGNSYDIVIEMDEAHNVTITYEKEVAPTVREKSSYVTISLNNWSTIGEVYDFSYADQPLFTFTENYKGFYIYEFHKNGTTHYAISRSIISPKAYMRTFSSLDYAKAAIDNNEDTLLESGLYSIKQHTGRPRTSKIEMKGLRVGQIVTTLDLKLPSYAYSDFSNSVKELLTGSVQKFQEKLGFIEGIETLDTPEKAVAFIYLAHKTMKSSDDFFEVLNEKTDVVKSIIETINSAPTVSYLVEKENYYKKGGNEYQLKLLQNNGTNISTEGKFEDITVQDFIDQNLNEVITYFNNQFGINIHSITRSELELLSKEHSLGLENKLDTVKAFVLNGEIYINTSNANAEDLFHELSHILLGVVKAANPEAYEEIIKSYQKKGGYKYQYNIHRKTYTHYAEQDVVEETIADMIASDMFKAKQLGESNFEGNEFLKLFENILTKSEAFTKDMRDNGLGFSRYISSLLSENGSAVRRNMSISELIRQYISEGKIKENC